MILVLKDRETKGTFFKNLSPATKWLVPMEACHRIKIFTLSVFLERLI